MTIAGLVRRLYGAEERNRSEQIAQALQKWKAACAYFQNVEDPDLIDFAVYDMEAARRKYVFLLKRYKE